jgi:bifunctional DNA-binding transcriptional regulator/antitoxin component of YhaV-PrlF toxin-antitoxin module
MARLDRSGRVHARALLDALGWHAGHRLDVAVVGGVLVLGSASTGLHTVGNRGVLTLPAAARSMCGIDIGPPVVLLASLLQDVVVVHPTSTVCRVLAQHHARLEGVGDDR